MRKYYFLPNKVKALLLFVIMVLVLGINFVQLYPMYRFRFAIPAASKQILSEASSTEELEEAVGKLGIVIELGDGSWIAIRYIDSHSGGIFSNAIALDSDGRWYESSYHFCGRFYAYKLTKKSNQDLVTKLKAVGDDSVSFDSMMREHDETIFEIENASNLEDAQQRLLELGFRELKK